MQMPVVVGILLAVMFLVTFSGWFYEVASGLKEYVLDDKFFSYRIVITSLISMAVMITAFVVIATVNECPNKSREGLFAGLKCESYLKLKASADALFQPQDKTVDQAL